MDKALVIPVASVVAGILFLSFGIYGFDRWLNRTELPDSASQSESRTDMPELTDEQKIDLLRNEAQKRGLKWKVTSCYWNWNKPDQTQFLGQAVQQNAPFSSYIEDGAVPYWLVSGKTQGDAAYQLYLSIQGNPNWEPRHKEDEDFSDKHRKEYPSDIGSEAAVK